jgi:DNA invertase Pin-like site-specific DNA recombinase
MDQADGDSRARQERGFTSFCERHGLKPAPDAEHLTDMGLSAYKDIHRTKGKLGVFLAAIRDGKVPRGRVLVVEALDRLARLRPDLSMDLARDIMQAGIDIGVVGLGDIFTLADLGGAKYHTLSTFFWLAHQESKQKAERIGAAWGANRRRARDEGRTLTRRLPGWVEIRDGRRCAIPRHVKTVKLVFTMAAAGYGHIAINKRLIRDKVPCFLGVVRHRDKADPTRMVEKPGRWTRTYIKILLEDRRVLGEFQTYKGADPDGPPIPNYFPRVITPAEWNAARAGCRARDRGGKKQGRHMDLWAGLLRVSGGEGHGGSMMVTTRTDRGAHSRVIINTASVHEVNVPCLSFPLPAFESAILGRMREIDPSAILPREDNTESESQAVRNALDAVEAELTEARVYLKAKGFSATIADHITELEGRKARLESAIGDIETRMAHPVSESWRVFPSLVDALDGARDKADARLRLRTELRRMVESVWLLVVRRSMTHRLCAVQVYFAGGARRECLIHSWAAGYRRAGGWRVTTFKTPNFAPDSPGTFGVIPWDLRDATEAEQAENWCRRLTDEHLNELFGEGRAEGFTD